MTTPAWATGRGRAPSITMSNAKGHMANRTATIGEDTDTEVRVDDLMWTASATPADTPANAPHSIDRPRSELATKGITTRPAPTPPTVTAIMRVTTGMRWSTRTISRPLTR